MNRVLKFARINSDLTQKELALRVGVSSKYISILETNGKIPSPQLMKKISAEVQVSVQQLFFEE